MRKREAMMKWCFKTFHDDNSITLIIIILSITHWTEKKRNKTIVKGLCAVASGKPPRPRKPLGERNHTTSTIIVSKTKRREEKKNENSHSKKIGICSNQSSRLDLKVKRNVPFWKRVRRSKINEAKSNGNNNNNNKNRKRKN